MHKTIMAGYDTITQYADAEKEALSQSKEFTGVIKISPEQMNLLTELLSLTTEQVSKKYGSFENGDALLSIFRKFETPTGEKIRTDISFNLKNHETDTPFARFYLYLDNEFHQVKDIFNAVIRDITSPEQIFSITDEKGRTWNVDLHADERMRRLGKEFVFHASDTDPKAPYLAHDGELCTVERMLNPRSEVDTLQHSDLLWEAKFKDGTLLVVYDFELDLLPELRKDIALHPEQQKPVQLQSLDTLIAGAEAGKKASEQYAPQVPSHSEPSRD